MSINNNEKNSENPQEKNQDYEVLMKQKLKKVIDDKLKNIEENGNYPENIDEIRKIIENNDYKNIQKEVSQYFVEKIKEEKISELDTNNFLKKNLPEELKLRLERFFLSYQNSLSEAKIKYKKFFKNSNIDEKILEENLKKISFEDLKNMTFSALKMKKIFEKYNFEKKFYEIEEQKIKKLFDELGFSEAKIKKMTEEEIEEYEKGIKFFERYGFVEKEFFAKILELSENNSEKQKLITYFNPTISYNEIIDLKILDENGKTELEKKLFDQAISGFNQEKLDSNSSFNLKNDKRFDSEEYKNFVNNLVSENPKISIDQVDKDGKLIQNQDFLQKIIEEIQKKSEEYKNLEDLQNVKIENLEEFKKIFGEKLVKSGKNLNFEGLNIFDENNFITINEDFGRKSFWKIVKTDATNSSEINGVILEKMTVSSEDNHVFWNEGESEKYFYNYDELDEIFTEKLEKNNPFVKISREEPELPEFDEVIGLTNFSDFVNHIDEMDVENKNIEIKNGVSFSVMVGNRAEIGTFEEIDEANKAVKIRMFDEKSHIFSWIEFLTILTENNCHIRRIGEINSLEKLAENFKITSTASNGANKLTKIEGIEYNSDSGNIVIPDSEDKNKKNKVRAFMNSDGTEVYEVNFSGGKVDVKLISYGKATSEEIKKLGLKSDEEIKKMPEEEAKAYKIERDRTRKKIFSYNPNPMTYENFLQIIQDAKATIPLSENEKNKKLDDTNKEISAREGNHIANSNPRKRLVWTNVKTVKKMIEGKIDFEKEKWKYKQEVRESYAFIGMSGPMGRVGITKMTKLIDSEMSSIKSKYMGKDRRQYIEKEILNNPKAKPHEVLAGGMLVLEMAGHFYPDSFLSEQQDRDYKWFVKIAEALGLNPRTEYKRCYDKCAGEKPDSAHRPPEEDMVERLFKFYQDNPMVQSIGGGAKFWNMAPAGRSAQEEKGAKEVEYNSTAQGRSDYILAKMKSNEFEIALGALPKLFAKGTEPELLGPIFAMAAGNAPNYIHNGTLDKLKNISYTGIPFHGLYFVKNKETADLYKDVIKIACQKYDEANGTSLLKDYQKYCKPPKKGPDYTKSQYVHNEEQYDNLAKFWAENHKIIHPILQGVDPTLQIAMTNDATSSKDKKKIEKYLEEMWGITAYMTGTGGGYSKLGEHSTTLGTLRPNSSWHFSKSKEGVAYRSFSAMELAYMPFSNIDKSISGGDRINIFDGQILEYFRFIRDNPTFKQNPEYQKKQFKIVYLELVGKISSKTFGSRFSEKAFKDGTSGADPLLKHFNMLANLLGKQHLDYGFWVENQIPKNSYEGVVDEAFDYLINRSKSKSSSDFVRSSVNKNINFTLTGNSANDNLHKITT